MQSNARNEQKCGGLWAEGVPRTKTIEALASQYGLVFSCLLRKAAAAEVAGGGKGEGSKLVVRVDEEK